MYKFIIIILLFLTISCNQNIQKEEKVEDVVVLAIKVNENVDEMIYIMCELNPELDSIMKKNQNKVKIDSIKFVNSNN